jgi:hypothetical protein
MMYRKSVDENLRTSQAGEDCREIEVFCCSQPPTRRDSTISSVRKRNAMLVGHRTRPVMALGLQTK